MVSGCDVKILKKPSYVETCDDIVHPIAHVGKVPLAMQDSKRKYFLDVLHVPNITKNLVSIGHMVEQSLHVKFNPNGYFVENLKNQCCVVAKCRRNCRMFTLDADIPKVQAAMFAHERGVIADIEIWHNRIRHVNIQRLKSMQTQSIVAGNKALEVIHSDVWTTKATSLGG